MIVYSFCLFFTLLRLLFLIRGIDLITMCEMGLETLGLGQMSWKLSLPTNTLNFKALYSQSKIRLEKKLLSYRRKIRKLACFYVASE